MHERIIGLNKLRRSVLFVVSVLDCHFPTVGMRQRATTSCYPNNHKRTDHYKHTQTDTDYQPGTGIHA